MGQQGIWTFPDRSMVQLRRILMKDWLRLHVTIPRDTVHSLSTAMEACGALAVTLENAGEGDSYDVALPGEPLWTLQRVTALFPGDVDGEQFRVELGQAFPTYLFELERLADRDWERSWLENFHPVRVGPGLWVCPSWLEPVREEEVNLCIDPGLAFGSGTHATTALCLEYLATADLGGLQVIDFGCGSGILAIAALKLGAHSAVGTDIDERALHVANENARRNGVEDRFGTATAKQLKPAELVIANILATTLLELQPLLCELVKPDGRLLLSGILAGQVEELESCYRDSFCFQRYQRQEWMLLAGIKK